MEWVTTKERMPILGEKGLLYSPSRNIAVSIIVTRNPEKEDGRLYWHFIHPNSGDSIWNMIWPTDVWKPLGDENGMEKH